MAGERRDTSMRPKTSVEIVVIDDDLEALALRAALEWWGIQVTLHLVGQAKDLVAILGYTSRTTTTLFLMCHGNEQGIILPELHPNLEREQPYHSPLTPADLTEFMHLPDCITISTGCATGAPAFASAFLEAGCHAYVGPTGYPNGDASLFYTLHLCYEWICRDQSLLAAHQRAMVHDGGTSLFHLYERSQQPQRSSTQQA